MDKTNLPDLPGTNDKKFWGDAECYLNTPSDVYSPGPHYFERVSGHSAQCKHCNWGFQLEPGDKVENGHVYSNGKIVI